MNVLLTPEHIHLSINHIPLIGLPLACIPLLCAVIRRDRGVLFVGLLMALLCSASLPFITWTGDKAAGRLGDAPNLLDAQGKEWAVTHSQRADTAEVVVYITLGASLLGLLAMWKFPRLERPLGGVVLLLCVASTAVLVWVADAGGKIHHPEFRAPIVQAASS